MTKPRGVSKRIQDLDYASGDIRDHVIVRNRQRDPDDQGAEALGYVDYACQLVLSAGVSASTKIKDIFRLSA